MAEAPTLAVKMSFSGMSIVLFLLCDVGGGDATLARRLMKIWLLTTNTTTSPLMPVISEDDTWISRWSFCAPTSKLPKNTAAGMVPRGCRPPNSAATMPLKPAIARESLGGAVRLQAILQSQHLHHTRQTCHAARQQHRQHPYIVWD